MSLFDFTFSLSAVILGLALTHLAASTHRLLLAGRRVRWAPEPVLLAAIVLLVIVSVWLFQWDEERNATRTTIGLMLLQVLKLLVLYIAAAFVLPDPPGEGPVDMFGYYDRTRPYTFGALILSLALFTAYRAVKTTPEPGWWILGELIYPVPYLLLIFVRTRWINIAALSAILVYYGWTISGVELKV